MSLYYSKISDYQVEDGILNIYLPLDNQTKDLYQILSDMRKPSREYFDHETLIAVEWFIPKGFAMLKKLEKLGQWREIFAFSPTSQNQTH